MRRRRCFSPRQCNLEDAVSSDEWGQAGQALFPRSSNSHQQGITVDSPNDSGDLRNEKSQKNIK